MSCKALSEHRNVTDKRRHRGRHPRDTELFAAAQSGQLTHATAELSDLLGRGYPEVASLKLVGDHLGLRQRQRLAVRRCACTDAVRDERRRLFVPAERLRGRRLAIDGFNAIVTMEAALSGGLVLIGRDGAHRDLSSVHGSYRTVEETQPAVDALVGVLADAAPSSVTWLLDRPVSNSGRLAQLIRGAGEWTVELVDAPDKALVADRGWVVATSDSWILDRAAGWTDLPAAAISRAASEPWVVDLSGWTACTGTDRSAGVDSRRAR